MSNDEMNMRSDEMNMRSDEMTISRKSILPVVVELVRLSQALLDFLMGHDMWEGSPEIAEMEAFVADLKRREQEACQTDEKKKK